MMSVCGISNFPTKRSVCYPKRQSDPGSPLSPKPKILNAPHFHSPLIPCWACELFSRVDVIKLYHAYERPLVLSGPTPCYFPSSFIRQRPFSFTVSCT